MSKRLNIASFCKLYCHPFVQLLCFRSIQSEHFKKYRLVSYLNHSKLVT